MQIQILACFAGNLHNLRICRLRDEIRTNDDVKSSASTVWVDHEVSEDFGPTCES